MESLVTNPSAPRLTYTVEEAAQVLGVSRGLAYELVRTGRIPSVRLGQRRIIIPRGSLEAFLNSAA